MGERMSREERVAMAAERAERSRTRAAQAELRHSQMVARLQALDDKRANERAKLVGRMLIEGAKDDLAYARVLASVATRARDSSAAKILDGWTMPDAVETALADLAKQGAVQPRLPAVASDAAQPQLEGISR